MRIILIALVVSLIGCSASKQSEQPDDIVGTVDNEPVTFTEILSNFKNNNTEKDSVSWDEFSDFADLYLIYRSKLEEAQKANYAEHADIKNELEGYSSQYAIPYWMRNKVEEKLLKEMVDRSDTEIKAQHLLMELPKNPTPKDTARIYNSLMQAREQWLDGADFEGLNQRYSSVRNGRSMGGTIDYFSSGPLVKPFEDVAFNTPVDSISKPFRTQFGYHVVKVLDRREKTPERQVSHIFIPVRSTDQEAIDSVVTNVGGQIYQKLNSNELTWREAVKEFSQDRMSIPRGGQIGFVRKNQYNEVLTDSIYNIENVGDITRPFYSGYGLQIIRLDSIRTFGSDSAKRASMLAQLKKLPRYKNNEKVIYEVVRDSVTFDINEQARSELRNYLTEDSVKSKSIARISIPQSIKSGNLLTLHEINYSVEDYLNWLYQNKSGQQAATYSYTWFEEYVDAMTGDQLVEITSSMFPEFKRTIAEYKRGLMVFNITQDSVWNYAQTDTTALLDIYNNNKGDYQHKQRYRYVRVMTTNDSLLSAAREQINQGVPVDTIRSQMENIYLIGDTITDISEEPFDRLAELNEGELSDTFTYKMRQVFFYLQEIIPPGPMTFDEAYYRLVSDYQPIREESWNQSIRQRNNATIDTNKLKAEFEQRYGSSKGVQ